MHSNSIFANFSRDWRYLTFACGFNSNAYRKKTTFHSVFNECERKKNPDGTSVDSLYHKDFLFAMTGFVELNVKFSCKLIQGWLNDES